MKITGISYSPSVCVRKTRSGNIILAIKPHEKRFVKGSDCHEMAGLELVVFRELIQPYDGHGLLRCLLTSSLHGKSKPHPGVVEKSSDVIVPINAIYFKLSKMIA